MAGNEPRKPIVLCVDGNSGRGAFPAVLRNAGYTVLTASTTSQALRAIAYLQFDAVILDSSLVRTTSVMDALAAFNPRTALMLLVNPSESEAAQDQIAHARFAKPLQASDLLIELGSLLAERPQAHSAHA